MARRCPCDRLLAMLDDDVRLKTLPLATRMLWLILARYAVRQDDLRIPFSGIARVSLLVSASETEVETQLEILIAEGLLIRDGASLRVPLLDAGSARAAAARANGAKGGRPTKEAKAERERLARAQGHLRLPIQGGGAAAAETQGNLAGETPFVRAKKESNSILPSFSSFPSAAREASEMAQELSGMFGLKFQQVTEVLDWMGQGATPAIIRQVAKAMAEKPNRPVITSIRYLRKDVLEQTEACTPAPASSPADAAYIAAIEAWHADGCLGPAPIRTIAA